MENKNLKFGVSNFRVFDYSEEIFEFAPITFLTGPNSSGKSSIMKAMLLFKDNFDGEHIPLELKFNSEENKLSSIQDVLKHKDGGLEFKFKTTIFNYLDADFEIYYDNGTFEKYDNGVTDYDDNSYFELLTLKVKNQLIFNIVPEPLARFNEYKLDTEYSFLNFPLIKKIYLSFLKNEIENSKKRINSLNKYDENSEYFIFFQNSIKELNNEIRINTKILKNKQTIFELDHEDEILTLAITDEIKEQFKIIEDQIFNSGNKFNHKYINQTSDEFKEFIEYFSNLKPKTQVYNFSWKLDSQILLNTFFEYCFNLFEVEINSIVNKEIGSFKVKLSDFGKKLKEFCKSIFHQKILESIDQINNIKTIPISKNSGSAIFDMNRKATSFLEESIQNYEGLMKDGYNSLNSDFLIKKWLNIDKFGIGKDIIIEKWKNLISFSILDFNNRETNISNLGFGVGQILSLLLLPFELNNFKIYPNELEIACLESARSNNKIIYLEEPESNLHPKWQSLLVELLLELYQDFGYRFIIETHSEYMIRKAQYLVAKDNKCQDDFKIYYFNGPSVENLEKKYIQIEIKKDGSLTKEFGTGFTDEALNLEFELLKVRNFQQN